jgi:hypothetical protein
MIGPADQTTLATDPDSKNQGRKAATATIIVAAKASFRLVSAIRVRMMNKAAPLIAQT